MKRWAGLAMLAVLAAAPAGSQETRVVGRTPVVNAVLFYSPACPHCHDVINESLPPLLERFGAGLRIVAVDASTPAGSALYGAVVQHFRLPPQRQGVPTLVVADRVMVGSDEIPAELPGLVTAGLAAGGVDWPAVPQLLRMLEARGLLEVQDPEPVPQAESAPAPALSPPAATAPDSATPVASDTATDSLRPPAPARLPELDSVAWTGGAPPTMGERFLRDPTGNGAAVAVLIFMIGALTLAAGGILRGAGKLPESPAWTVPALAAVGVGVATYLAWVEVTGATAVCGPVGDCNAVQQSPYARLFGIVPVGVLGVVGYVFMAVLWAARRQRLAALLLWVAAAAGTLFSMYLTFLEPFVIGATCAWCLTSAVVTTLILLAATPAAGRALPSYGRLAAGP